MKKLNPEQEKGTQKIDPGYEEETMRSILTNVMQKKKQNKGKNTRLQKLGVSVRWQRSWSG